VAQRDGDVKSENHPGSFARLVFGLISALQEPQQQGEKNLKKAL